MRYNMAQLLMEPTGSTRDYEVAELLPGPENGTDRIQGWVRVIRTHQGVLVRSRLETQVRLTCSRCISEFEHRSLLTMEEEFFPTIDPATGRKTEPSEESEGVVHLDAQHDLDMSEVVRQYVLTEVPIKPLCSEECPGLCPECGKNLNEEQCTCSTASADPRWGSLAELLTDTRE